MAHVIMPGLKLLDFLVICQRVRFWGDRDFKLSDKVICKKKKYCNLELLKKK